MCILYGEKLCNDAMVPSRLKQHFTSKHSHLNGKNIDYFRRLLDEEKYRGVKFTKKLMVFERALEASFVISHMIAKNMKAHTIGESLLEPACEEIMRIMLGGGDEAASKIGKVPLTNNTVARRISKMSRDTEKIALEKIGSSQFTLQADKASDYSGKCHLQTFIQFVDGYNIIDHFLFIKEMKTSTTDEDIFHIVDTLFTCHGMLWDHCVGICTDGAPIRLLRLTSQNYVISHWVVY